jgi:DnaK suppressor protein
MGADVARATGRSPAAAGEPAPDQPGPGQAAAGTAQATQSEAAALVVREDESPWTTEELDEVRRQLQELRGRIAQEMEATELGIASLLRDGGEGAGNDQADVGSTSLERDAEMSLAQNARDMLFQVERALARTENGTYGVCESCGNAIGKQRLLAFPRATLCMTCKQREERR